MTVSGVSSTLLSNFNTNTTLPMSDPLKHLDATSLDEKDAAGTTFEAWLQSSHYTTLILWTSRQASDASSQVIEQDDMPDARRRIKADSIAGMHFIEGRLRSLLGYLQKMRTPPPNTNPRYTTSR